MPNEKTYTVDQDFTLTDMSIDKFRLTIKGQDSEGHLTTIETDCFKRDLLLAIRAAGSGIPHAEEVFLVKTFTRGKTEIVARCDNNMIAIDIANFLEEKTNRETWTERQL